MKKIVFTGGGSAGHVVPNIALMEELLSDGDADVCYVGTDGIEKKLVSEWKIPYFEIHPPKFVRGGGWKGLKQNLKIPVDFSRAVKEAKKGLETFRPDAVFSKGGYVALPVVIAAHKLNIPCFAHESDFSAGLANKLSARYCKRVFTSFPETAKTFRRGKYSGTPMRKSILSVSKAEAKKRLGISFDKKVLLVFGGGSGSAVINEALRKHLKTLTTRFVVLHACGKGNLVQSNVPNYLQTEFISDMGTAYAAADLVVSRAGAGTIFEILALKKSSVLIPLEGQTRGDQAENADYFNRKGLCRVLFQRNLDKLPQVVFAAADDQELKDRLNESSFTIGNECILRELRDTISSDKNR